MFVKYPEIGGPKQIILLLKSNGYNIDYSYNINDFKPNYHNAIIIPGGTARVQQNELKKQNGIQKMKQFIKNGGGYIGFCAGAYVR